MNEEIKNEVTEIIIRIIKRGVEKGMDFEAAKKSAFKAIIKGHDAGQMLLSAWVDAI